MEKLALGISIGALLHSSFGKSIKESTSALSSVQKSIKELNSIKIGGKTTSALKEEIGLRKGEISRLKSEMLGSLGKLSIAIAPTISLQSEVLKAQGEIASLGIAESGINAITEAGAKMSRQFAGVTTPDFIRASYDIKSGISSLSDEGVAEFTRLASLTAKATKSTTADMSKLFAMGHGIFRKEFSSDEEFGNAFSGGIATAVKAFRTDGSDLVQGLSNLGASATAMGVGFAEQMAIIGVSKSAFNSASESATSYRAFIDGAGKAQEKLGLEFTDSTGKMLPMVDILEMMKGKYGDLGNLSLENQVLLKEAFGSSEALKMITALSTKTEELKTAQKDIKDGMNSGDKTTSEMAESMNRGEEMALMMQNLKVLGAQIGEVFYPIFSSIANGISFAISKISSFISENKILASWIIKIAGGLILAKSAINLCSIATHIYKIATLQSALAGRVLGISTAQTTIALRVKNLWLGVSTIATKAYALGVKALSLTMGGLRKAFAMASVGVVKLGIAFMTTPVGWILGAIALIAGAVYLIYKNWENLGGWFSGLWESIKGIFGGVGEWFGSIFGAVFDWLGSKFEWVSGMLSKLASPLKSLGLDFGSDGESKSGESKSISPLKTENQLPQKQLQAQTTSGQTINISIGDINGSFDIETVVREVRKKIQEEVFHAKQRSIL